MTQADRGGTRHDQAPPKRDRADAVVAHQQRSQTCRANRASSSATDCGRTGRASTRPWPDCGRPALGPVSSPAILVGHSYGGTLIPAAGNDDRVAGLVYIAALAPDETETSQGQQDKFPRTDVFGHVEVSDGRVWVKPEGVSRFAGDLSPEEQGVVYATHFAPALDLFTQKHDGIAWRTKRSWSIVATEDRTVHPDLERSAAKRMGATTVELKSSHVPMLSHPDVVLNVIHAAAKAVQGVT